MTEKLYWKVPYDTQFEAKIIKIIKEGIILDKTLFIRGAVIKQMILVTLYSMTENLR